MQEAMAELMKGRTRFVIAHRLSTIQSADLFLLLKMVKSLKEEITTNCSISADFTAHFIIFSLTKTKTEILN